MSYEITFFKKATGEILSVDEVTQATLMWHADAGTDFLLGGADSRTQYVVDGALVDYTIEERLALASLAPGWVWQMPERRAVDQRTTGQARAIADERVNVERDRRIAAFDRFTFNGVLYDGDAAAKENITDAAAGAAGGVVGALISSGVPEEDAHVYAEGVRRGGTLVTAQVEEDEAIAAEAILDRSQRVNLTDRRDAYTAGGWNKFDDTLDPYSQSEVEAERNRYRPSDPRI